MSITKTPNRRITVRFTQDDEKRLKVAMERRGYATASAFIREALSKEFTTRGDPASDAEQRLAATLERLSRDIARFIRGQQALFAVVDTLAKAFLTCVPEPPQDGVTQSVARARDRYARFIKSAGQAMVGDSQAAMDALVDRHD
jgi:Arc/MetJ-type ribon-helix-helix transcriptional regulator